MDCQKELVLSDAVSLLEVVQGIFVAGLNREKGSKIEAAAFRGVIMLLSEAKGKLQEGEAANEILDLLAVVETRIKHALDNSVYYPGFEELAGLIGVMDSMLTRIKSEQKALTEDSEIEGGGADGDDGEAVDPDDAAKVMMDLFAGEVGWPRILSGFLRGTNEVRDLQKAA